ncbi:hypothetical protein GE09DRAFT_1163926 [Coniochaeta sp. 2T2.1]|nr:hypothetical protein GE09DRAFT_1163926 [Coniochaeta sp. 2T2.1]
MHHSPYIPEFRTASRHLETHSVAFFADAFGFFMPFFPSPSQPQGSVVEPWPNLRKLALTSNALHPQGRHSNINHLLTAAGRAAAFMPQARDYGDLERGWGRRRRIRMHLPVRESRGERRARDADAGTALMAVHLGFTMESERGCEAGLGGSGAYSAAGNAVPVPEQPEACQVVFLCAFAVEAAGYGDESGLEVSGWLGGGRSL